MKIDKIKIGLIITVVICLVISLFQYASIDEYKDELDNRDYQINELKQTVDKLKNEIEEIQDKLDNCNHNLQVNRNNNAVLLQQNQRRETREFLGWDK